MGFNLRCVITPVADADEAAAVVAALTAALPHTRGRMFEAPFRGVLVGADPDDVRDAYDQDPAAFADALARIAAAEAWFDADDEDERAAAIDWLIPSLLASVSAAVPDKTLAYVEVDCFGGVCMYSGELVRAGQSLWRLTELVPDGHQQLLGRMLRAEGVEPDPLAWYFAPFERGFLDGADPDPSTPPRRGIAAMVTGTLAAAAAGYSLDRLGPVLSVGLHPDWRVAPIGPQTLLLTAGAEDLLVSINPAGEQLELGGRCHVDPAAAEGPLSALAELLGDLDLGFELTLETFAERAPLRRWSSTRS